MAEFVLQHEKHPHFASAAASGAFIHGPSSDQFVHMIFFRDAALIEREVFQVPELKPGESITLESKDRDPLKAKHFREDVASIIMQPSQFLAFAKAVAQTAELLIKKSEE